MDGTKTMALLHETQFHPVSDAVIHADFTEMSDAKEATVSLSLNLKGQSAGVRKGGVLSQKFRKLRVKGLPNALPEHLDIDISGVELGHSMRVSELNFPGLSVMENEEDVVLTVKMPKKVEEVAPAAAATTAAQLRALRLLRRLPMPRRRTPNPLRRSRSRLSHLHTNDKRAPGSRGAFL